MAKSKLRHTTVPKSKDADFIALARKRFQQGQDGEKDQRRREVDDLKFYAGEQWPKSVLDARSGSKGDAGSGLPAVPARPCLVIDKIRSPISQVLNEERHADLAPQLVPADDFGAIGGPIDETEIELREGLLRKIMRESEAADAFSWAFSRAVQAGRGYFGVMTRYLPGRTFDQEVFFKRFYNQNSVTLDPSSEQPDGSDAEWGFDGGNMPWEQYVAEYPVLADGITRNPSLDSTDADFRAQVGDDQPDWFHTEGEGEQKQRYVRVTDYYYTVREPIKYAELPDGTVVLETEVPEGVTPRQIRTDVKKQIKWAKIDGKNILDTTDWMSPYIPIIKVLGVELHPYDKDHRVEGMVRPATSSQIAFNAMASKQVEVMGYQPLSPFMIAEGQIEGYESWYEQAATRGFPYLPFKQRDLEGNPAGPPIRSSNDTNIQAISQSVALFSQTIKDTTGVPGPTIGETDPSLRSAAMVKQLVAQSQRGTSNFMDNLTRSLRHGARIVNSLLPTIYGRQGRIAQIITKEHQPQTVSIGPANPNIKGDKNYKLTPDADFNVAIKVTKNFETVRQEEAQMIGELVAQNPELMMVYGDLLFKNMDTPGHIEMAERAKAMLAPPVAAIANGQQPIPPEVQQKLQQSGQMIQELTQHVNDLTEQIKTKQIEQNAMLQKAQEDNATKLEIAKIQAGATLAVADVKAQVDQILASAKAEGEQLRIILEAAQEERLQRQDHIHEATMTGVEHGHDRMAAAHDTALEMTRAAHEVAITPEPPSPNGSGE